jgi:hypothetical protein
MRCLAHQTRLQAVEFRDASRRLRERRLDGNQSESGSIVRQLLCSACGHSLLNAGSVLFQGDHLVHALCWRADLPPSSAPPTSK